LASLATSCSWVLASSCLRADSEGFRTRVKGYVFF
jgi:hypothetical protein